MDSFVWDPSLNLGVEQMDTEHMKWFSYLNAFHAGVISEEDPVILIKLLDDLIEFSREHFSNEEAIFASTLYPDAAEHKEMHYAFLEKLLAIRELAAGSDPDSLTQEVTGMLKSWLVTHVKEVDRRYVKHLEDIYS